MNRFHLAFVCTKPDNLKSSASGAILGSDAATRNYKNLDLI